MFQTKKILSILLATTLVLTIFALIFGVYLIYINSKSLSSFTLNYTSKTTITPKNATFDGFISTAGKNVSDLDKESERKLTKMLEYLKTQSIPESDITTNKSSYEDYSYQPVIDKDNTTAPEKNYRLDVNIKVKIDKIDENQIKATIIQSKLVELGVNRFDKWEYGYQDNENLDKICYDLEIKGIETIKQRAVEKVARIGGSIQSFDFNSSYMQCADQSNNFPIYRSLDSVGTSKAAATPENEVNKLLLTKRDVSVNVDLIAKYRI